MKNDNEEQLYLVVETKGSTSMFDLRGKEQGKIECGEKHFDALDSKMILAKDINDVESEIDNFAMGR